MSILVQRSFVVPVPLEAAWHCLADVEGWPSWAPHIRSVELDPPGSLRPRTRAVFRLRTAPTSAFAMVAFEPPVRWQWAGRVAGLRVTYDHRLDRAGPNATRITLVVVGYGPLAFLVGRPFGWLYARNLDRAIPRLIDQYRHASDRA
jgi:hypothetical protein